MSPEPRIINVVIAGLGGQGVVKASDILAEAAFHAGYDVKKSEIHGMSQRGGSVSSDVRLGPSVQSPMVPAAMADYLVLTDVTQHAPNIHRLRPGGVLIGPGEVPFISECHDAEQSIKRKTLNVALLGVLSASLPISIDRWLEALRSHVPPKHFELNVRTFFTAHAVERCLHQTNGRLSSSEC